MYTKAEFVSGLKELHIGEWKRNYGDPHVTDGTQWELELKQTLDPEVIHAAVLRVMTEQGVPGWAKRFFIKGQVMELVKMNCE